MLTFVGLGLYDEKDITIKGLEAIKKADVVYAEFYTSRLAGTSIEKMEKMYGKSICPLTRKDIEERAERILEDAKNLKVVLLSGGDAMIATTHVDLRLRAMEEGIETRIVHAPSISSAAPGLCGLQNYKFGKSATVSPPHKNNISEVPYDTIIENKRRGLHTLLYLDLQMSIKDALAYLQRVEERKKGEVLKKSIIIGIGKAGSDKPIVKAAYLDALQNYDFGDTPHTLVILGNLHFLEKEALSKISLAPRFKSQMEEEKNR